MRDLLFCFSVAPKTFSRTQFFLLSVYLPTLEQAPVLVMHAAVDAKDASERLHSFCDVCSVHYT